MAMNNDLDLTPIEARVAAYESLDGGDDQAEDMELLVADGYRVEYADLVSHSPTDLTALLSEVKRLRRERDAAVEDIMCRDHCDVCKYSRDGVEDCDKVDFDCAICQSTKCKCRTCRNEDKWDWRGPSGEGEDGNA